MVEGALLLKLLDVLPSGEIDAAIVSTGTSQEFPSEASLLKFDPEIILLLFGLIPVEARSAVFAELLD